MSAPTQASEEVLVSVFRTKMVNVLKVYPRVSPSMLHIGIGPSVPASIWKPELEKLVSEGIVVREICAASGGRTYTVLRLSDPNYQLPIVTQ